MNFIEFKKLGTHPQAKVYEEGSVTDNVFIHKNFDPITIEFFQRRFGRQDCARLGYISLYYPIGGGDLKVMDLCEGLYTILVNGCILVGVQVTTDLNVFLTLM